MKNLKLLTVFTLLVLGSISLSAQDFGVVSIEEIFRDLPAKKSADATLEALVEQHQTKNQRIEEIHTAGITVFNILWRKNLLPERSGLKCAFGMFCFAFV